jgi:anti-sigma factor RsiW
LKKEIHLEITCRQVWKQISNYLDGEVPANLRDRLERHFADCHHCSAMVNGARNTVTLVADERAFELPKATSRRLYSRLAEFIKEKK